MRGAAFRALSTIGTGGLWLRLGHPHDLPGDMVGFALMDIARGVNRELRLNPCRRARPRGYLGKVITKAMGRGSITLGALETGDRAFLGASPKARLVR